MNEIKKCPVCGKAGKRLCPACGGLICASCCGAKRGSGLPCPSSCPYFPFGREAYDLFLNVNWSWTEKTLRYVVDHVGKDTFEEALHRVDIGEENLEDAIQATMPLAVLYLLGYHHIVKGRTVADLWEEEGWAGLNNDERFMMKYRRRSLRCIRSLTRLGNGPIQPLFHLGHPLPAFQQDGRQRARRAGERLRRIFQAGARACSGY
jgi:hypothetical protein